MKKNGFYFLLLLIFLFFMKVEAISSQQWHTTPDKWEKSRIYHSGFDPDFSDRIQIFRTKLNMQFGNEWQKFYSPNDAYWVVCRKPDTMKPGPWVGGIKVFNERDYFIEIDLINFAAQYPVTIKWINEKLFFVKFWLGRISGIDFIFDAEKEKIIYKEMFRDGSQVFRQWREGKQQERIK
jgi:hypothetical protein